MVVNNFFHKTLSYLQKSIIFVKNIAFSQPIGNDYQLDLYRNI